MAAPKYVPQPQSIQDWDYSPETGLILDIEGNEVPYVISSKNGEKLVYIKEDQKCVSYTRLCLLLFGVDLGQKIIVRRNGDYLDNRLENLLPMTPGDRNHFYFLIRRAQKYTGLLNLKSEMPLGDPTKVNFSDVEYTEI